MKALDLKPEEAMAFGDAASDIPFIRMSGLGIALGNASTPVKEIADYVTSSVDEDGIAHAIFTLFGNSYSGSHA